MSVSARIPRSNPGPMGAGLRMVVAPKRRASRKACRLIRALASPWQMTTLAPRMSRAGTSRGPIATLAPIATMISFWLEPSTRIAAAPVARPRFGASRASIPSERRNRAASAPNASRPTAPTKRVRAPARAHATAWFEPLPPGPVVKVPMTVSPAVGKRPQRNDRSLTKLPTTTTLGLMGWPSLECGRFCPQRGCGPPGGPRPSLAPGHPAPPPDRSSKDCRPGRRTPVILP